MLQAVVDEDIGFSEFSDKVSPAAFTNMPQSHFTLLRTSPNYTKSNKGKFIISKKVLQKNVTELLPIALTKGILTSAYIIQGSEAPADQMLVKEL